MNWYEITITQTDKSFLLKADRVYTTEYGITHFENQGQLIATFVASDITYTIDDILSRACC